MILGAGRGTRLAALGLDVPKILVEIGGESLLARQLAYLAREGVDSAVVNAHHRAEQVIAFANGFAGPPTLRVVREPELLGTAGGLRNALSVLRDDEPIVVLYGDVLFDEPIAPLVEHHRASGARATLTVYESVNTEGKGTVAVDDSGRVLGFAEKSAAPADGPALINAGLYVVAHDFIAEAVEPGAFSDFGDDVFPGALARGVELRAHRLPRPVLDIGTPEALREATR